MQRQEAIVELYDDKLTVADDIDDAASRSVR
jgi:hypothetical protein